MSRPPAPSEADRRTVDEFAAELGAATGAAVAVRGHEVQIEGHGQRRLDAQLSLALDPPLDIAVEVVRNGYPSSIQAALWMLLAYRQSNPDAAAFVIGQISPGARALLRDEGVGYFDLDGSLYFRHANILVNIEKPPQRLPRKTRGNPFAGAREKVIHALLHTKDEWTTGLQLADLAQVSTFTVSTALTELSRREWVASEGKGRNARCKVVRPAELLQAWAHDWKAREHTRSNWFTFSQVPNRLVQTFLAKASSVQADVQVPWALTGAAAGNMISPLLTSVDSLEIIVPPGTAARCAKAWGMLDAQRGPNVTIFEREDASDLFRDTIEAEPAAKVASPWIVYLDLLRDDRGRNKELASVLREQVLKVPE